MGTTSTKTNEKALKVFEKLLLYGFTDEQLVWSAANKFSKLNQINQAIDYIQEQQHKNSMKIDKIYGDYFRLLLKTRLCVLEENSKCTLIEDESLSYKERITWCGEWIETDIIKTLINEWHSIHNALYKAKAEYEGDNIAQTIANMIRMSKSLTNRLSIFQDTQIEIGNRLNYGIDHESRRKMNTALREINDCLDSYVEKGKSVLMEAMKYCLETADDSKNDDNALDMKRNSFFTAFWNIFTVLSLNTETSSPAQIFDPQKIKKMVQNEIDSIYWILVFNTRSKIKLLMIKGVIRQKYVMDFLDNTIKNKNELIDNLCRFDSTICSYTGLEEWNAMKNAAQNLFDILKMSTIMEVCKILIKYQNDFKQIESKITENINKIQNHQTKQEIREILLILTKDLDKYIQNAQHILNEIEHASTQCFDIN